MEPERTERRVDLRVQFSHPVKFMTAEVLFEAEAVNLGEAGLCVRSPLPFESGTEVAVLFSFTAAGDAPFLALAEVIWCEDGVENPLGRSSLLGLRFQHLSPKKSSLLTWHVHQLALSGGMLTAHC
jgi:hypothetical protein